VNILVVDDNKFIREIVSAMIVASDHRAISANGHQQALASLAEHQIDLILMDIEMPEMDGFELTKKIRQLYHDWIPIIFLSANNSDDFLAKGIDIGGDDYLTKPVNQIILTAKIRAMERISLMKSELDRANKQLEILSSIDPLTQVLNRRGLDDMLEKSWQTNIRQHGELSILMIDIDYFKPYNDHYGHPQGDKCLAKVANVLSQSLSRSTYFIARYGGEEFMVVLPFTPIADASLKAKEMITALQKQQIKHEYSTVSPYVTVSIGLSSGHDLPVTPSALIEQSDKALYHAKESGRNQCSLYENL